MDNNKVAVTSIPNFPSGSKIREIDSPSFSALSSNGDKGFGKNSSQIYLAANLSHESSESVRRSESSIRRDLNRLITRASFMYSNDEPFEKSTVPSSKFFFSLVLLVSYVAYNLYIYTNNTNYIFFQVSFIPIIFFFVLTPYRVDYHVFLLCYRM